MKKYLEFALAAAMTLGMAACDGDLLETSPTSSVSGTTMFSNATAVLTPLNGVYRMMYEQGWSTDDTQESDGLTAWNLVGELMGDDMIMTAAGNGWYWYDYIYDIKQKYTSTDWRPYDLWNGFFSLIANVNYIIAAEETMEGAPADVHYAVGQAYAIRAYCYYELANYYSRPYIREDEKRLSEKCVPIYTEPTQVGTPGKPRASIKAVYSQILSDINKAVELLSDAPLQKDKTHIDYRVANGIKSRICLTIGDWKGAEEAATIAMTDYSIASASDILNGMNDVSLPNVMWGATIIPDQGSGWGPIHYHMDAISMLPGTQSYAYSAPKCINLDLYSRMGESDARRGWWQSYAQLKEQFGDIIGEDFEGILAGNLLQTKIRFKNVTDGIGDKLWMRVEEMYLTKAEALCRQGNETEAKAVLGELMANRDENYTCSKSGTALGSTTCSFTGSLLEEILIQRRIELWGEYGRLRDIRRLGQGIVRKTSQGFPSDGLLEDTDVNDPDTWAWVITIPQTEFDGNVNMDILKDQNRTALKGQPTGDDLNHIYVTE